MKTTRLSIVMFIIVCCVNWTVSSFAAEYNPIVEQAQKKLMELGYDPGQIDGKMGKKTIAAIKSFQKDNALQATGELNELTIKKLDISITILPDPGTLTSITDAAPGKTMLFKVTGKTSGGSVWGTDMYTTDSTLALVAVHAGVLKDGEEGIVKVTFAPGQSKYKGTARNGVTSSAWESYNLSYTVEAVTLEVEDILSEPTVMSDPGNLANLAGVKPGDTMLFKVTGKTSGGSVWGTDIYTTDSTLALVAVHAGVLKDGEEGIVKVTFAPGQSTYEGTARNGVTSSAWESYGLSYKVEPATVLPDPGNLTKFTDAKPADMMLFRVTGKTTGGSVWGTDLYTTDSALALVAVHAGVLKDGEEGIVKVIFEQGQSDYEATTRNGVASSSWGSYDISFRVEAVNP